MSYNKLATTTLPKHIKLKTYFLNVKTPTAESSTTPPLSMQLILISITKSSNINSNTIKFPAANHKLEKENTIIVFASSIKFLAHHETAIVAIVHE
jgi:hypothetical protein